MIDQYTEYMLHCCRCAAIDAEPLTWMQWAELYSAVTKQL